MSDELRIRDLSARDTETLVEIALAAWEPVFAGFRRAMGETLFAAVFPDWRERKAAAIRSACHVEHGAGVCVAELRERVVGFVTFHARRGSVVGEIGNNAVHPEFQNRGIGTALYRHACGRLRAMGMRFVCVTTGGDPAHAPARRAYEKAGFATRVPLVQYYRAL